MKIIILGGDGFCGWPNALHLSNRGHDVIIVDNLSRRAIDLELEVESLTPIRPIGERIKIWEEDGEVELVVYDNLMNQPISGGNIIVHKAKE